jgi:hypothetical protein
MFDQFHLHFYNFPKNITSSSLLSIVVPHIILIPSFPIHHVGHWTNAEQACLIYLHLSKDIT